MKKKLRFLLILSCIGSLCLNTSAQDNDVTSITLAGVEIEAEDFSSAEVDDIYSWEIVGDTLAPGMSNGLAIQASPADSVKQRYKDGYETQAPSVNYEVNFEEAGTYYFFFRANTLGSGKSNSSHFGVSDGTDTTTFTRVEFDQNIDTWHWGNTLKSDDTISYEVTTPGLHELTIWVREMGTVIDKILVTGEKDAFVNATGLSLDQTTATVDVGSTVQLTATVAPENATDKIVTWSSSADTVATVDANGLVTGVSAGTATITVTTTDGGLTATAEITVNGATTVDIDKSANFNVYPNPVKDHLFIVGEQVNILEIISVTGKTVMVVEEVGTEGINVSNIEQGIYLLKISTGKGTAVKSIVKE